MKKNTIAALIAGLVLGATGTAGALTGGYWQERGSGYTCEGVSSGTFCKAGGYEVGVTKDYVYVQRKGTKETFGCRKWSRWSTCVSD